MSIGAELNVDVLGSQGNLMDDVMTPELSIVIPCFNAGSLLPDTLRSLKSQVGDAVEIILVDDGSTDDTSDVVRPFIGESIRYFWQKNSGGPASPRNVGIKNARSDLIGFFDADDFAISDHFLVAAKLMRSDPKVGMVCGNFHISDESLCIKRHRVLDEYSKFQEALTKQISGGNWLLTSETALNMLLQKNFVGTASVVIRKSVFERVGYFDEAFKNLDDRDMWLRVARQYDLIYRDEPTYIYRSVPNSISKQGLERQALERIRVCEKLVSGGLSRSQCKLARQWTGRNLLAIGYSRFDRGSVDSARAAFMRSYFYRPSWAAFKGVAKSLLPAVVYRLVRRFKHRP